MSSTFHILIADDDLDDQAFLSDAVRSSCPAEVQITTVANGSELMKYLEKRDAYAGDHGSLPHVILLDINMPLINGLEALKLIKGNPALRHIHIYVITTMRNFEKLEECLDLGASNFYTKPNGIKGYRDIVSEVLRESKKVLEPVADM